MCICDPWYDNKNKQFFTNMKIKETTLRCNIKHVQGIIPMGLGVPLADTYIHT